jgi:cyclic beta-1,2-glucan synthetase
MENIALGFYQDKSTAESVIKKLSKRGFSRFASIYNRRGHPLEVRRYFSRSAIMIVFLGILAAACLALFNFTWMALLVAAAAGVYALWRYTGVIGIDVVDQFKNRVLVNEILVIAQVDQADVREALEILRQVKSGHPVTFLLRPALIEQEEVEIPAEPVNLDVLEREAEALADNLQKTTRDAGEPYILLSRFKQFNHVLQILQDDFSNIESIEQTVLSSAEWLLDNMYVLQGSLEDIKLNLSKKYYKTLPKIASGPLKGIPRIYVIASELVKHASGRLTREAVTVFLESYQTRYPLTIGELWAFPLMLRYRLIEWVEFLALRVDGRMREGEFASYWGNRLLYATRHEPERISVFLEELAEEQTSFSGHFAEELLDHLFDEEAVIPMVREWLETRFQSPLADILHQEHVRETAEQVVFSNSIRSLIALSQLSWPEIFESVSAVDAVLREDPIYPQMDFTTRNSYRECIEEIARRTGLAEVAVAKKTLSLAKKGARDFDRHIGYYLIDDGRQALEKVTECRPTLLQTFRRGITKHSGKVYLGGIFLVTVFIELMAVSFLLKEGIGLGEVFLLSLLGLLPISELSVQCVNYLLTLILPAHLQPKMSYKTGIPQECKTLVVVPVLLQTPDSIREEIDRLEIRYLANSDPQLCFGLFSDFSDAPEPEVEGDAPLLAVVMEGIGALERKYGENKFFLFHRRRIWSKSENAWIGWERKRGKLEYLNRFLMGEELPENIVYRGNPAALSGIRYVITLDADTQLSKNQARALIEVIAHPLNRAYLSPSKRRLERGYTIIQPSIGTDFIHSKASLFCQIFSEATPVDPYTQAISNVYQDLVGESSYHGKGIYDVETFHTVLSHHFPEEHLLSHDLIEGAYVRVAFAGHVCLRDMHPKDYLSWVKRQHRWLRGDWQIIDWLWTEVPTGKGASEPNTLSLINRWKIFDNLRRALLPISLMVLLAKAWIGSTIPEVLTAMAVIVLILPSISLLVNRIAVYPFATWELIAKELGRFFSRSLLTIALLPVESFFSLDAMFRVAFRRLVSRRNLLQWIANNHQNHSAAQIHRWFVYQLVWVSLFSIIMLVTVDYFNPSAVPVAFPFCLLWFAVPLIVHFIDRPITLRVSEELSLDDQDILRKIARKTWRYFDELVRPHTHWLPPDNSQTSLNVEVAMRTSPTNIGFWFTSLMSAYDFKYITSDQLLEKIMATMHELKKLERYQGHFLNWYDIGTLQPLFPRYVSTVDSGNLLASLWTLNQGIKEILVSPIIPSDPLQGVRDTFEILLETKTSPKIEEIRHVFDHAEPESICAFIRFVKEAIKTVQGRTLEEAGLYWIHQVEEQLLAWDSLIGRYFVWAEILDSLPVDQLPMISSHAALWKSEALHWQPSLKMLADGHYLPALDQLIKASQRGALPEEIKEWGRRLKEALNQAQRHSAEQLGRAGQIVTEIEQFSEEMRLSFLYSSERKLFAIGFNVDEQKLDNSYYDLLLSEARIASLVAIAKEDAPMEHWWTLGRMYSRFEGRKVLLSWGGTMFEYLMPLLFSKHHPDSLIGEACKSAVACQIAYGKKRGIPWGISESAFSAIDSHKIYQYKSFGIPGLGLKRGLEEDLVVSPYSSALALAVDPKAAIKNLKRMGEEGDYSLMGTYGYYESMDFTRQKSPTGERGVIVHAHMAHHQGMIFAAINNALNHDALIKRFHNDPRIAGVNALLYERIPHAPSLKTGGLKKTASFRRLEPFSQSPIMGVVKTPESVTPKINLLSNGQYSLMITNTGGGYSRWGDIEIYRWRADTTQDAWGSYCYVKDRNAGTVWSTTYQPTQTSGTEYTAHFTGDKALFKRIDNQIETITEIDVSPEDNAEIRLINLINRSTKTRHLELTSYLELALAPHLSDRSHPSFNKLFIQTEALPEHSALLGYRRLRSSEERPIFAAHVLAVSFCSDEKVQYETDRARFIGRGRSLMRPAAMDGDLSNTTGTVLDPIFSLRRRVVIEPGQRVQFSYVTVIAESRDEAVALVEKYKNIDASHRAIELGWTYAQLELRHLRIHQEDAQLFQKLASRLLYPHHQLRTVEERLRKNMLGQSGLWPQGISGDLPIVVVTVGDIYDIDLVKQLLIAHSFWRLRGLIADLIIFNEEEEGYRQPIHEHLQNMIYAYAYRGEIDVPGGVYLRNSSQIPADEYNLILSVARAVLIAARGPLRQQLVSPKPETTFPQSFKVSRYAKDEPSQPLPFLELPYFNGLGGYTPDGRSYVIYLGPDTNTPAPWINVLANPQFGTLVSETGLGCAWYGNSQSNRLTPWSNDPLLNPITDTIYLRDEELGSRWTPTPSPIRELDAYRVWHTQGSTRFEHNSHGIGQDLVVFVPVDDIGGLPVRIQRLRLTNHSSKRRRLSATAYTEWVLGSEKEDTQMHVVTEWDSESQAIFAYNRYNPDFGSHVAFSTAANRIASYTGDRTEFIGRNRTIASPVALERTGLSGRTGAGLDPCAALQVIVDIDPGKQEEIIFIMGYTQDEATARQLVLLCQNPEKVEELLQETHSWWDKTLETIQVDVPDLGTNFLLNRWLVYQSLSCRFWGRAGFYQSSGAYGFRDQLQDSMTLAYFQPEIAREYILQAAARQFPEGDVQHWWHAQTGAGVRTRCSDDLLWLPYVTAHYVRLTGDVSILEEKIPFLEADKLQDYQDEVLQTPSITEEEVTLLEHCRRAIKRGTTAGPHGLPLIGSGDWNDGMNRVGIEGRGESVWLGWFLIHVMNDFADLLSLSSGTKETGEGFRVEAMRLANVIEGTAWDGAWYVRAYFDDGTPIGSKKSPEATIDSLTQSWAVISGHADPQRCKTALNSAYKRLVKIQDNIVLLLTPPFDKIPQDPGYIKGYPPGVRENGGQYTHGSSWLAMAYARIGDGNQAANILQMITPISHTTSIEASTLYKVEPYVIAADIYDLENQVGRGGWTWYTGSASWVYRIWLEEVLGFKLRGETVTFQCAIPKEWNEFTLRYRYKRSHYTFIVKNPDHISSGETSVILDGVSLPSSEIPLVDDGKAHTVEVVLREAAPNAAITEHK